MLAIASEARYKSSWSGPGLFSMDCYKQVHYPSQKKKKKKKKKKNLSQRSAHNKCLSWLRIDSKMPSFVLIHQLLNVIYNEVLAFIKNLVYHYHSPSRWLSWVRHPTGDQEVAGSIPAEVGNIVSWRLIVKYFFTVILSLPLIQEGQLSVSGERMCTILVNRLED